MVLEGGLGRQPGSQPWSNAGRALDSEVMSDPSDPSPSSEGRTFQAVSGASHTERVAADPTPLVFVDDEDEADAARTVDSSRAEMAGELKGLRSRLQILRAERTAIAGKRYALEVMLEGIREKLEALNEVAAGGDLADIQRALQDLNLAAEGRGSGGGLEGERLAQLEEMQRLEAKLVELKEKSMGYRSERDGLREQMSTVGGRLDKAESRAEAAEARVAELEAAAAGSRLSDDLKDALARAREESAVLERASRGLQNRMEGLRASLDGVIEGLEEGGD
jgi:chromosome segregation ATPase